MSSSGAAIEPPTLGAAPKVMAEALRACLIELETQSIDLDTVAAQVGSSSEALSGPRSRVPWDVYCDVMALTADAVGGVDAMRRLGHRVEHDAYSVGLARALRAIASARTVYNACFRWIWPSLWPDLEMEHRHLGGTTIELRVRVPEPLRPCPPWFSMARGVLERAPCLLGLDASVVTLETDGTGREGRFSIQHAASGTLWAQLVARLRAIFTPEQAVDGLRAQTIELNERLRELNRARDSAEDALASKERFLTNVSHELRTPLAGAMGLTEILVGTELDPKQRGLLEEVTTAHRELLRGIEMVMDYSQVVGRTSPALGNEPIDASELVRKVVGQDLAHLGGGPDGRVRLDLAGLQGRTGSGDRLRIERVVHELIRNALVFGEDGPVHVRGAANAEGELELLIDDEGPGIPAEAMARAFDAFDQADGSLTRRHGGLGLGLPLTRHLVEVMGGRMRLESRAPEPGTRVGIVLPLKLADRTSSWSIEPGGVVLVVDDNPVNRRILRHIVGKLGFEVEEAENGEEALDRVRSRRPVAILMDCQMPVMDGLEATRRLRASLDTSSLPIIAVTAHAQPGYADICFAAGMNAYLSKPIDRGQLAALLEPKP